MYEYVGIHVQYSLFLSDVNQTGVFLTDFRKISNFMEIPPVEAELFHADGRTDRQDVANGRFRYFTKAVKKN